MNRFTLTLLATFAASAAVAETCQFTAECLEGETCAATAFAIEFTLNDETPRGIVAVTDFGDLVGTEVSADPDANTRSFAMAGDGAVYLLSQFHDQAWLSVRMDGPFTINYLGTCDRSEGS